MKASPASYLPSSARTSPRALRPPNVASTANSTPSTPKLASYVSRRPVVWAGGFAIIVIAGTILGAQLKSRQQAQEREQIHRATQHTSTNTPPVVTPDPDPLLAKPAPSQTEINKQIAFLEERRGSLLAQKMSLERKLEEVERKQQLDREMQARKKQELGSIR